MKTQDCLFFYKVRVVCKYGQEAIGEIFIVLIVSLILPIASQTLFEGVGGIDFQFTVEDPSSTDPITFLLHRQVLMIWMNPPV